MNRRFHNIHRAALLMMRGRERYLKLAGGVVAGAGVAPGLL